MGTFGERLRREREMRGITLEEIAEATKIGSRSLRALEQEQFEKLPGGIFNKGFVRAYARYLGIDEEQAVADYLAATQESEIAAEPPLPVMIEEPGEEPVGTSGGSWRVAAVIVLIAAIAAGGLYVYNRIKQANSATASEPEQVQPQAPTAIQPQPAADVSTETASANVPAAETGAATPAAARPETAAAPVKSATPKPEAAGTAKPKSSPELQSKFSLRIVAHQDCWMTITADDKIIMSEILRAPGEKLVRAQKKIVLTAGNAGGLEVSFNGKTLPTLGGEKQPRTVTFTPQGIQQ